MVADTNRSTRLSSLLKSDWDIQRTSAWLVLIVRAHSTAAAAPCWPFLNVIRLQIYSSTWSESSHFRGRWRLTVQRSAGRILQRTPDRGEEWLKESWDRNSEVSDLLAVKGERGRLEKVKINTSLLFRGLCEIAKLHRGHSRCHLPPSFRCEIFTRKAMAFQGWLTRYIYFFF